MTVVGDESSAVHKEARLTRAEYLALLKGWYDAWNQHDLDEVLRLMHPEVHFEHWDGRTVIGTRALRLIWSNWFAGRDFQFVEEETFIDDAAQKALFRWVLRWPASEPRCCGIEERRGLDVLHFHQGLILRKLTYSKTD
jgi:hypothetical protein